MTHKEHDFKHFWPISTQLSALIIHALLRFPHYKKKEVYQTYVSTCFKPMFVFTDQTSTPIVVASSVFFGNYDRPTTAQETIQPTDRPTNQLTDLNAHREVPLPIKLSVA